MDLHFSALTTTDSSVGAHRATARIPTTLNKNQNSVILSEASEFVARAFCAQQSIQTRVEWTCISPAGTITNFSPERTCISPLELPQTEPQHDCAPLASPQPSPKTKTLSS
jgi:hypothetical protein